MCWRRIQKFSWTDRAKNAEVLQSVKEWNILHIVKVRKAEWIGYILSRNCLLQHFIEGKVKVMGRRGRRRENLRHDLNEKRGNCKGKAIPLQA